jgi:apolipoprotein N-acyltransferase
MLWTAIEFYRSELFFLRFAWITPGAALGPTALSPIVGVYGASALVVATASAFVYRRTRPLALLLTLCILGLTIFRPAPIEPDRDDGLVVTVVQSEDCFIDPYIALTLKAKNESPDLVVWPEHALPYDLRKNEKDFSILTNLCAKMEAVLIVGTKTIIGVREFVGVGETGWYNTALALDRQGVIGEYYKVRPVHLQNDGIPGDSMEPIRTDLGSIGTPICFDFDYTTIARKMVGLGAEYFVVPSFDARSWTAMQHWQHSLLFRLRAAENARWTVCAASSGVSQIIDPHGHVHASIPPMETGIATHWIERGRNKTVFTRFGWLFPWFAIACVAALLIYSIVGSTLKRRPTRSSIAKS